MRPPSPEESPHEPDVRSAAAETAIAARAFGARIGALGRTAATSGWRTVRAWTAAAGPRLRRIRLPRLPARDPARPRRRVAPVLAALALVLLLAAGTILYALATLPIDGGLQAEPQQSAIVLEASAGETFAARGIFRGDRLTAAELPPHLAKAIVAIEDRRFHEHRGVDLRGIARALWRNTQAGETREGGSTITQQLVRLLYLTPDRTFRRKLQEAILAPWLEWKLGKGEILIRYLNTAFFGAGAYGVDAAARRYFGKSAREVTLAEAAMLAGLVRAPSQLAPTRNLGGAKERARTVLRAMVESGAITQAEADAAGLEHVALRTPPETPPGTNYLVDTVVADVRRLLGPNTGDLTLRTTLNLELQRLAEAVIERRLDADGEKRNVGQAALVALAPDGAVLAMVGGRDYEASQFNRVTQARRQPGSLFKLFVYQAAFERGFTPASRMTDEPIRIGDWEPQNAGGRHRGPVDLRTAFALSLNTVAARLAQEVGVPRVIETAKRMGVQSELAPVPSLALGSAEVTLLEMTRAFAAVAAGAERIDPFVIHSVQGGQQALYARPGPAAPLSGGRAETRAMMLDLLQAVVEQGTGKAARLPGQPVGGKTGTTQEHRDAWFVGSTPGLTVGVWVGNDDNAPMQGVTGGDLPARIWRDFVERALPLLGPKAPVAATTSVAAGPERAPAPQAVAAGEIVKGVPQVVDTGTLEIDGRRIRLVGVEGEGGRMARQLAQYLRRAEIVCEPVPGQEARRCSLDGEDLSEMILLAGGARASEDAPPHLLAAEEEARSARLGLWRQRRR